MVPISGWKFCIWKVFFLFKQETRVLMKFQDPSWHSFIIALLMKMFILQRVIRENWIPSLVSPYLKPISVDKGWLQYLSTALVPHQRNKKIKQNIITDFTRHIFFILSLTFIVLLEVIKANVSTKFGDLVKYVWI